MSWFEEGTNLLRQKVHSICVKLLLSAGACTGNAAKEDDSMQHKTSVTVPTYYHWADNLPGAASSLCANEGWITGSVPQAISFSSSAQLGNNCLLFRACSFYLVLLLSEVPTIPLPFPTSALALNADETLCITPGSYSGASGMTMTWPTNIQGPVNPVIWSSPRCYVGAAWITTKNYTRAHKQIQPLCRWWEGTKPKPQVLIEQRLRKVIAFEMQCVLLASQRPTVIKNK